MNAILHPLARFLVALIFIMSGVGKIFSFADTAAMMGQSGFPAPWLFLIGAILLEVGGGVLLLVGYQIRLAAVLLIAFIIPATIIFHASGLPAQDQVIATLKNLAILGALIKFYTDGAGAYALDERRAADDLA